MKKFVAFVLAAVLTAALVSASEELEIFSYLYDAATTPTDQLGILQSLTEMGIPGVGSLYARAMARLVREYPAITKTAEKEDADSLAIILAEALGNEKQIAAAPDLWRAVGAFANPLVKSEAIMALGKMRATAFFPQVRQMLLNLNAQIPSDRLGAERIAFGTIISLEKYQDAEGYLPVFFASNGWYSDRIKSQAVMALPVILADPTEKMLDVVKGSAYPAATKLVALKTIEASQVSGPSKSTVALAALTAGLTTASSTNQVRMDLAAMRKMSMDMIRRYGNGDPAVYQQLTNAYNRGLDLEEKLAAIQALAALGTDESARELNGYLAALNRKQKSGGVSPEENQLVRAIIPALGSLGKTSSQVELRTVGTSGWAAAVTNLAAEALRNIR